MTTPPIDLPSNSQHPLDVHINRNGFKESLHEVVIAVGDADGSVILSMGDVESVIFPRSAMKPLQSIALIKLLKTLEDIPEFQKLSLQLAQLSGLWVILSVNQWRDSLNLSCVTGLVMKLVILQRHNLC